MRLNIDLRTFAENVCPDSIEISDSGYTRTTFNNHGKRFENQFTQNVRHTSSTIVIGFSTKFVGILYYDNLTCYWYFIRPYRTIASNFFMLYILVSMACKNSRNYCKELIWFNFN